MALAGFIVAVLAGMRSSNPAGTVIITALVALVICNLVGTLLGLVIDRVMDEHRRTLNAENDEIIRAESMQSGADESGPPDSGVGVHERNVDNVGIKAA